MSQSQTELLNERYGRIRNRRRDRLFAISMASLALVGFGAWSIGYAAWQTNSVSANVTSYRVVDEYSVSVDLQVTSSATGAVQCDVRALASDFTIVGFKTVTIPAGQASSLRTGHEIVRTTHRAVSADVKNCRLK